jgi:hypothetical protein
MTITSEHSDALIDDVVRSLERHWELTVADVRRAIAAGTETQADLAQELVECVGMALTILHRVLDGVSILSQVGADAEPFKTAEIEDVVALIQVLALTTELARRSRETAAPLWDLLSHE